MDDEEEEDGYYRDTGCKYYAPCLTCPFPRCVEELDSFATRRKYVAELATLGFDMSIKTVVKPKVEHAATCKQADCDDPFYARDLCHKHYRKLWREGLPNKQVHARYERQVA